MINDGQLEFCIEMEKLKNNLRYTSIEEANTIADILGEQGYAVSDIDLFVVDGWGGTDQDALAIQPRLTIGNESNLLSILNNGSKVQIGLATYREQSLSDNVLKPWKFDGFPVGQSSVKYESFLHVTGHLMSTYCTSPFAGSGESSYQLVWDGGMFPRLYFIDPAKQAIENLGPLFFLIGNIYTIFSQHFGPFKVSGGFAKDNLSIAGKVMAYISLGEFRGELYGYFDDIYKNMYDTPMGFANIFANEFKKRVEGKNYSDEDILFTFHMYLQDLLINKLKKKVLRDGSRSDNLCLSGGCALNIKWNSAIRNSGLFKEVYVSPFPNDSGSAIGMACAAMVNHDGKWDLDWGVYSGPVISEKSVSAGWNRRACSISELAQVIHETQEPVVFLSGRAELGPRALGNRSILASATSPKMKDILNEVKKREKYRPVSPICKIDRASELFTPGGHDPFMLFDHQVKKEWLESIPAVVHLDNTARLQTVSEGDNAVVYELLSEYEKLSGIPLLCNTSANYKGSGFFPDIQSVMSWGEINYIYCNGSLYEKTEKKDFSRWLSHDIVEG